MNRWIVLATLLPMACCGTPAPRYVPDPGRNKGLPSDPVALVQLADAKLKVVQQVPGRTPPLKDLDMALAALEKARKLGRRNRFEVLWKLSRVYFLMASKLKNNEQKASYARKGRDFAGQAAILDERQVEPHYYRAMNISLLAQATRKMKLIKSIISNAKLAARIDASYDNGGPLRLLGTVHLFAPAWPVSVGSPEKAVDYLRRAVLLAPVALNRLFLGQALFHDEEYEEAGLQLRQALAEGQANKLDRRWLKKARDYLRRLSVKEATSPSQESPLAPPLEEKD
jgi:tetratricopeptide (TPR) repeat protein